MNQLAIAGIGALLIAGGSYAVGWKHASNSKDATELAIVKAAEKAASNIQQTISDIPKKFIPIKGDVVKEFHHDEKRYYSDTCSLTDPVWVRVKQAYEAAGGVWPREDLPVANPATGSNAVPTGTRPD